MKASTMSAYACPLCPCATHLSNHGSEYVARPSTGSGRGWACGSGVEGKSKAFASVTASGAQQ